MPVTVHPAPANGTSTLGSEQAFNGFEPFNRMYAASAVSATSGRLNVIWGTARQPRSVSKLAIQTRNVAASGLTLARVSLWRDDGGTATLVAQCANDPSLFTSNYTLYQVLFSTPLDLVPGVDYGLGLLVVGTTMPNFPGFSGSNNGPMLAIAPPLVTRVDGLSDLPASMPRAGLVDTNIPWMAAL